MAALVSRLVSYRLAPTAAAVTLCPVLGPFATPGWSVVGGGCLTRGFSMSSTFATTADIQLAVSLYSSPRYIAAWSFNDGPPCC